ncbi:propionyl-CoA carboxylase [Luteimonas aestuarii]|uniref:Propionyl-CoA carboxylase n=1 Tax=Luteimonas aestuarii TaxID=453837 RepID=A0A4R5TYM5_9GAMM|nr:carboxyl transferase domain-containing protein [Luteimonas aestuarii]TDK26328.1 propionyl-CoA carboxylase [Luteimonas aestuarii]
MSADDTALSVTTGGDPLAELERRRALALRMGGEQALQKFRDSGRMNARERIAALLDEGSFREFGRITGAGSYDEKGDLIDLQPVNAIIGYGNVDGRRISVSADDYTIRAGSSEATISEKWIYAERYALTYRMPLVRLVDSAGGSVKLLRKLNATKIPGYSQWPSSDLMRTVPVVGVALGACAGLGAIKVLSSHFSVMVRAQSQVFAAGPPVVKQAYGIDVDKNALGGHEVHRRSALVHNEAEDERDALRQVRRFLSYLPRNVYRRAPHATPTDERGRIEDWLKDAVPTDRRQPYDPRRILEGVFDLGSVFEVGRHQGGSTITALARIDGHPVGVIAGDPRVSGGAMTLQSAYKFERHIQLCDTFGLPVVHFVDQPGNAIGRDAELAGTLLGAMRVGESIEDARVPWISIVVRRAFGMAGAMHAPKHYPALNHVFAWPTARWGSIPIEGGVAAAHRAEIEAAPDPLAMRRELEAYYGKLGSPFRTAERFGVVDVIDPRETRALLCDWIEDAREALDTDPRRPHAAGRE